MMKFWEPQITIKEFQAFPDIAVIDDPELVELMIKSKTPGKTQLVAELTNGRMENKFMAHLSNNQHPAFL